MKNITIIGAGITGLSTAWKLTENGHKVKIIEKSDTAGGLARSIKIDNYYLDIGPHSFFSEDEEVFNSVMSLFKGEEGQMPYSKRSVKMWFRNRYVDYPLSAKSVLFQMGIIAPFMSTLSFAKSYIKSLFIQKKYPKIEKFVQWASENYKNAKELGFSGGNNNLRFLSDNPLKRNTAGWIYLWDKEFGTNYTESNNFPPETRTMITYGIADASNIITQ